MGAPPHGGLLLDPTRLAALSRHVPGPLDDRVGRQLRQRAGTISDAEEDCGTISSFVTFVLEEVCGLDPSTGTWTRSNNVSPSWGRRAITGETVKPRHLWTGRNGARLNGLLERLERSVARGGALAASFSAWPRVLALFRFVRDGSHHPDLPVTAYGGDLFAAGATALRGRSELDENTHGQLLDKLHARGLLDDIGYRRRRDGIPLVPAEAHERLSRVAEGKADYQVDTRSKNCQVDMTRLAPRANSARARQPGIHPD